MASSREGAERLAANWERSAYDLDRGADRTDSDYTPIEKRLMRAQANVYRACAGELRSEQRKITRG